MYGNMERLSSGLPPTELSRRDAGVLTRDIQKEE